MMRLATILALFALCLNTSMLQAQSCVGPNKLKTNNTTAFSTRIAWDEGGGIETLQYRPVGTTTWQEYRGATSPITIGGLQANTTYEYRMLTDCATFTGTPPQSRFTTLESCNPATNVQASDVKINSAQLNWTRGRGINSETIVYNEVGSAVKTRIITPYGAPTYRLGNLKKDTEYEVVIESDCLINSNQTNNQGAVMSPPIRFTTAKTASCEDVGLQIKADVYSIYLNWVNDAANVRGYEVCYRILGSGADFTCKSIARTENSYIISSNPATTYEVLFKTTCSDGTIYESIERITTNAICLVRATNFTVTNIVPRTNIDGLPAVTYTLSWSYTPGTIARVDFVGAISPTPASGCNCSALNQGASLTTVNWNTIVGVTTTFNITVTCANGAKSTSTFVYTTPSVPPPATLIRANTSDGLLPNAQRINNNKNNIEENTQLGITFDTKMRQSYSSLSISPNPAHDFINIGLDNINYKSLTITAIDGRIVKNIPIDGQNDLQKIDCADLPKGLYFLTAKGDGVSVTEKFVKQ